jgi:hypothetical protein
MDSYGPNTVTMSDKRVSSDGAAYWVVYLGGMEVGTVERTANGYVGTCDDGSEYDGTFPRLTAAAYAVAEYTQL